MERNNLLNLLIVGGIAVAIALGGISLGVVINNKSTSSANTELVANESAAESTNTLKRSGVVSLYGGFKPLYGGLKSLTAARILKAKQEILQITVGEDFSDSKSNEVRVANAAEEVEILNLGPSVGNIGWIQQQLKYPKANAYTDQISVKTLHKVGYKQKIVFLITQKIKTTFNNKMSGIYAVQIKTEYVAAVAATGNNPAIAESWNLVFDLVAEPSTADEIEGVIATSMVANPKSAVFREELVGSAAIKAKDLDILLWKSGGKAKADSTDFDIAVILDKKTGKVYAHAANFDIYISNQWIKLISEPTLGS